MSKEITGKAMLPDWVRKHLQEKTEVHVKGGRYYLYQYSYTYNRETKGHKKTSTLIGRITEDLGLVPKGSGVKVPRKKRACKSAVLPTISDNVEYGISYWMETRVKPMYYAKVKNHFGIYWQTIVGIAFCRLVYQSPVCDMQRHFTNSFMSQMLPDARMTDKFVADMLRFIGRNRELQVSFFREFLGCGHIVIFDGTLHENWSQKMYLPQYTKLKDGSFGNGVNVMWGFSVTGRMPAYVRCLPGNIKDVSAVVMCVKEIGNAAEDLTSIFDKGFFSKKNIELLLEEHIHYVVPLRRSADVDYGVFKRHDCGRVLFRHESRNIMACRLEDMYGSRAYIYLDDELQYKERHDAQARLQEKLGKLAGKDGGKDKVEEGKPGKGTNKKFSNKPAQIDYDVIEEPSVDSQGSTAEELWQDYYDKEKKFGTIVLLTDKDLDAEQTYKAYKCRDRVEKMIDTLKTVLDADVAHMQDQDVFNGWMFCNHLALHWYYMLYNLLVDSNEIKHFSAQSVLTELGYHQIVKVNGEWTTIERTKKQQSILDKLGLEIKYPYK